MGDILVTENKNSDRRLITMVFLDLIVSSIYLKHDNNRGYDKYRFLDDHIKYRYQAGNISIDFLSILLIPTTKCVHKWLFYLLTVQNSTNVKLHLISVTP